MLPVTAALAGLSADVEHSRVTAGRARFAKAVAADAAAAAAVPRRSTLTPPARPIARAAAAAAPMPCAAVPPPATTASRAPPPAALPVPVSLALAAPRFNGPSGRTHSAPESASLVAAPDYEIAYLLDRNDYNYKSAGSLASGSADTVLLIGSIMGEPYQVQVDLNIGIVPNPRSYAAAVADPVYGAKWRAACDDDYKGKYTLLKTWELVKSILLGRRVIKGKWVFSVKYKPDGTVDKFKARYVGCGYN